MIARREFPRPSAQLTFTDIEGHRYQVFITDLADTDIAYLEALYRGRGRCERQIADTKDTGLTNLRSHSFAIIQAWLQLCLTGHDLLAWTTEDPGCTSVLGNDQASSVHLVWHEGPSVTIDGPVSGPVEARHPDHSVPDAADPDTGEP